MTGRFRQALLEKGTMPKKFSVKSGDKSAAGGLTAKGVKRYRAANPGSKLKTAVTTEPSKLKKGSKAASRRKSFCSRMGGMKKKLTSKKTASNPDSRINKALRKWNCSTDVNPNALQRMAEMITLKILEGESTGENPVATGERVGKFLGDVNQGRKKVGRRGAGNTEVVFKDGKKVEIRNSGRPKTKEEIKSQIKRLKKRVPRHAAQAQGHNDAIMTGVELGHITRGMEPDEVKTMALGAKEHARKQRRSTKKLASKLFKQHTLSAFRDADKPEKPTDQYK
jgi:hypothetical protein